MCFFLSRGFQKGSAIFFCSRLSPRIHFTNFGISSDNQSNLKSNLDSPPRRCKRNKEMSQEEKNGLLAGFDSKALLERRSDEGGAIRHSNAMLSGTATPRTPRGAPASGASFMSKLFYIIGAMGWHRFSAPDIRENLLHFERVLPPLYSAVSLVGLFATSFSDQNVLRVVNWARFSLKFPEGGKTTAYVGLYGVSYKKEVGTGDTQEFIDWYEDSCKKLIGAGGDRHYNVCAECATATASLRLLLVLIIGLSVASFAITASSYGSKRHKAETDTAAAKVVAMVRDFGLAVLVFLSVGEFKGGCFDHLPNGSVQGLELNVYQNLVWHPVLGVFWYLLLIGGIGQLGCFIVSAGTPVPSLSQLAARDYGASAAGEDVAAATSAVNLL